MIITPEDLKLIINLLEENVDPENTPVEMDTLYKKCNLLIEMAEYKKENDKKQIEFNNKIKELMSVNTEETTN